MRIDPREKTPDFSLSQQLPPRRLPCSSRGSIPCLLPPNQEILLLLSLRSTFSCQETPKPRTWVCLALAIRGRLLRRLLRLAGAQRAPGLGAGLRLRTKTWTWVTHSRPRFSGKPSSLVPTWSTEHSPHPRTADAIQLKAVWKSGPGPGVQHPLGGRSSPKAFSPSGTPSSALQPLVLSFIFPSFCRGQKCLLASVPLFC